MNLSDILLQSQAAETAQQADIALDAYKQQCQDYLGDIFQLVFTNNDKVSYLASLQAAYLLRKYQDLEQTRLLELAQNIINNYSQLCPLSRRHLSVSFSNCCAHLYFTRVFDHLPTKIGELIQGALQANNVDLLIDFNMILTKLYTNQAHQELNDQLTFQLKSLLENTQQIPLQLVGFVQQQNARNQILLFQQITDMIQAAYSWEDLPDYFESVMGDTVELLLGLLSQTGTSTPELEIEEHSLDVVINIIVNHFENVKPFQEKLFDTLITYVEQKNCDQREHLITKILQKFSHWVMSPELGEFIKSSFVGKFERISIPLLQFSELDFKNAESYDLQFTLAYTTGRDLLSRALAAEGLLRTCSRFDCNLLGQMQQFVQENCQANIIQAMAVFRVCVISSQSQTFGIKLVRDEDAQLVQQFYQFVRAGLADLGKVHILCQCDLFKFCFDFFDFLAPEQCVEVLQILDSYLGETQIADPFIATCISSGITNILNPKIVNKNIPNPEHLKGLIPKFVQMCAASEYVNEQVSSALCGLIDRSVSVEYFGTVKQILNQLLIMNKNQQSTLQFANLMMKMLSLAQEELQLSYAGELAQLIQAIPAGCFQEALVFILQIFAFLSRTVYCEQINAVFNFCLTSELHNTTELTQAMLLFVQNYLSSQQFKDQQFCNFALPFIPTEQTNIQQSAQLLNVLTVLIQKPSAACYGYQTLNMLLKRNIQIDQGLINNIIAYNFQRVNELYTNRPLLKQVTLMYVIMFNRYSYGQVNEMLSSIRIRLYDVLSQIVLIGCQSAFTIRDKKAYICNGLINMLVDQNKTLIKNCIGGLIGRIRNREPFVTTEKVNLVVNTCLLTGVDQIDEEEADPTNLADMCLEKLGVQNWR